ncbi:hypothetical protein B484DRAFT_334975 [Ochromonadaceae sp. CCMP2298]|nr:hypothetical protein B484DRAFT_334975 [Ochromonadaceae sp. CCMP2298]
MQALSCFHLLLLLLLLVLLLRDGGFALKTTLWSSARVGKPIIALRCQQLRGVEHRTTHGSRRVRLHLRRDDEDPDEEDTEERLARKLEKRFSRSPADGDEDSDAPEESGSWGGGGKRARPVVFSGKSKWQVINRAMVAGIFVAGIGLGITIDSAINTNPKDLASRDAIDRNAPNPKLCAQYGSSAMVLDQRVFITFNPFNVYVTQADTKPGCVLRPSNVVTQLQKERRLITDEDVASCKNGYNTWAFIGDINNNPQLNCVFQSDDAQNEFLSNPKVGLGEDVYDNKQPALPDETAPSADGTAPSRRDKMRTAGKIAQ